MKTNFLIFSFLLCCSSAFSQIIRVPGDYPTIQAGIDASQNGDTVLVSPGTYYENLKMKGRNILLGSLFVTTGDLSYVNSTVIDGSRPLHADSASCVLIINGEDSSCVIAGFTITGGKGTRWEDEHGPGRWYVEGGGFLIQYAAPTIRNNLITGNEAIRKTAGITSAGGGAIRCGDGNPHILNNMITFNKGLYGGGIVLNYAGCVIRNNVIANNSGGQDYGGGGLWLNGSGVKPRFIENNTIVNNSSTTYGGGIDAHFGSSGNYRNNIVYGNTAPSSPQAYGNPRMTYSDVQGGYTGTGNFDDNPRFAEEHYYLPAGSHCIDAGNPDAIYNDQEDPGQAGLALLPSLGTLRNDMGAYGGPGAQELPVPAASGISGIIRPADFRIYPNPATDLIHIELPGFPPAGSLIRIMNMTGNTVFVQKLTEGGPLDIELDGLSLPAGLYTISLVSSGSATRSGRVMILSDVPAYPGH